MSTTTQDVELNRVDSAASSEVTLASPPPEANKSSNRATLAIVTVVVLIGAILQFSIGGVCLDGKCGNGEDGKHAGLALIITGAIIVAGWMFVGGFEVVRTLRRGRGSGSGSEEEVAGASPAKASTPQDEKADPSTEVAVEDVDQPVVQLTKLQFALVFVGLAMAVFLAALDQTIVSVSLPAIATEFGSLDSIAWVATAFFLTNTAFMPTYGKLADIFGRKPVFLVSIVIFEIGSMLCGAATSMNMLIAARAIAGLGGGGIFSLVIIIIADLVPIRQRGNYQGIIGACFGLASVAGPLLGGFFTDKLTWRWNFYINGPIGAFTLIVVIFILRLPPVTGDMWSKLKRIDFLGSFLLILAVIFILIPLQGGGSQYEWNSPLVIGMFCAGGVVLILFALVEWKFAVEPIIPFELFSNRYCLAVFGCSLSLGLTFMPLAFYAPVYFQLVNGDTATQAGVHTIPLIMGVVVFSIASGIVCGTTGQYMPFIPLGGIMCGIGAALMATLNEQSTNGQQIGYLLIAGIGIGACIQTILVGAQMAVREELLAIVTSNTNFWQTIGGVFGLAITSTLFNNRLSDGLMQNVVPHLPPGFDVTPLLKAPQTVIADPRFPKELIPGVVRSFVVAISMIFMCSIAFAALLTLASFALKKQVLPKGKREAPPAAA